MKTLKQLFRTFISEAGKERLISSDKNHSNADKSNVSALKSTGNNENEYNETENNESINIINSQNQDEDETKNHEVAGDNIVAHPDNQESDRKIETEQSSGVNHDLEKEIEKAYNRGLIDGRNARIEETFFPKKAESVPAFRGTPRNSMPSSDIFSVAREA